MKAERISIKWMTVSVLITLAVVMLLSSIVAGEQYRTTALDFQKVAIAKSMDIAVKERMKHLYSVTMDLGGGTQSADDFKALAGAVLRGSDDVQAKTDLVKLLDDQFEQRSVNSGIVDLKKLKIYDTKLNLVVESSKGMAQHGVAMSKSLYNQAKARNGAERLKVLDALWKTEDDTFYSLLLPVGGLRLMGYLEVVVNPVPALKGISEILQLPVMIENSKGDRLTFTDDWEKEKKKTSLTIPFEMRTDDGEDSLRLFALGDMSGLHSRMTNTQWVMVGTALVLVVLVIFLSMWLFNRLLYAPVKNLVANMQRCARGDLTTVVESRGLSDLRVISDGLRDIVESLRNQVTAIRTNADQVASASTELSAITTETGQGAQLQSGKTKDVTTSMNEMAATVTQVAQNAVSAAEAAKLADFDAKKGQKVVAGAVDVISNLTAEVEKTSITIRNLEQESASIGKVLDVIRGVAEQTNLLALNAAIEAARAGEQGRGFAVVADEVRSLASKTQDSTLEIQTMIEKLQAGARDAVHAMDMGKERAKESAEKTANINEMLETMVKTIETVAQMNNQIAVAAEQQGVVTQRVNENVMEINELSIRSTEFAEKTAQNSEELADLAGSLQRLISGFKVS